MARFIDADKFFHDLTDYAPPEMVWDKGDIDHKLGEQPVLDVAEVRHGKWVRGGRNKTLRTISCSVCGTPRPLKKCKPWKPGAQTYPITWDSPYCPCCGAKMEGGIVDDY